ncbi:MAG: hypothetical protein GQ547_04615 [Methylophaga sp.]|nr:hypothetical protein [Methylophaga sp.]
MRYVSLMGLVYLACTGALQAASLSDSVLEIPKGTVFELRAELDIPANRNFILLGKNQLNESFNDINQTFNEQNGRDYGRRDYYHYDDYLYNWQQTVGQSYRECLERHRRYYSYGGDTSSNNSTIINQGDGNTNVIINNQAHTEPTYGSYIDNNSCIRPEHAMSVLLLDADESEAGGIFREGYEFKVKSVRYKKQGDFYSVTVHFDHDIATAIQIISTQSPKGIRISQLQHKEIKDGFWAGLGSALAGMTDIGGNHFIIHLASKRYYD